MVRVTPEDYGWRRLGPACGNKHRHPISTFLLSLFVFLFFGRTLLRFIWPRRGFLAKDGFIPFGKSLGFRQPESNDTHVGTSAKKDRPTHSRIPISAGQAA